MHSRLKTPFLDSRSFGAQSRNGHLLLFPRMRRSQKRLAPSSVPQDTIYRSTAFSHDYRPIKTVTGLDERRKKRGVARLPPGLQQKHASSEHYSSQKTRRLTNNY